MKDLERAEAPLPVAPEGIVLAIGSIPAVSVSCCAD